ncbi:hypothetical protein CHARACLAT_027655 [Characodon lateralis]|uniref:HECT domain-containing protein n=1 Tax=Characodon lateralis TaxID=208331 RepID=A0ABU7E5H8_9TELE|nr:hypothetical protein [Characodon lateralis]
MSIADSASRCGSTAFSKRGNSPVSRESTHIQARSRSTDLLSTGILQNRTKQDLEQATPPELNNLIKFWTGWENLPASLSLGIVQSKYPTAATCYETLQIPGYYKNYKSF